MKKFFTTFFMLAILVTAAFAQQPSVSISVDEITNRSFTCSFEKSENCNQYAILSSLVGEMDQWAMMSGSMEAAVSAFGITCVNDTTYTWDNQQPGSEYVVYVVAKGESDVLYTDTLTTLQMGGSGASVIEVSVSNIGDTSVTTTAVPNDQTMLFKDLIVPRRLADSLGMDSLAVFVQNDVYVYYETDTWTWLTLSPGTEYFFTAIGMNADSVWGELAMVPFTTTGENGIVFNAVPDFQVYPNPVADKMVISGIDANSKIMLLDAQGRMIQNVVANDARYEMQVAELPAGIYFVAVQYGATAPATKKIVKR